MKKSAIAFLCLLGVGSLAYAQWGEREENYNEPCQYTFLQNMIRDARNHEKVFELIKAGVSMNDETITCGGTLFQLAVRRGNPSILNGILAQDKGQINRLVPLRDFRIPGAPDVIPSVMFAAYYAPSEVVFRVMLEAGADVSVKDSKGHDILWYLDQNPVLRRTKVEDNIQLILQTKLLEDARHKNEVPVAAQPVQTPELKKVQEDTIMVETPEGI